MKTHPVRLAPGVDLRMELERLVRTAQLNPGFIVAGIGSISGAVIRFANDEIETTVSGPHEILTLSGSVSKDGAHLHFTVASRSGAVLGGHVCYGNAIRTTAEILLLETPNWNLSRVNDEVTKYKELVVTPVKVSAGEA